MNMPIVGAVPATQRGKFQTECFLSPFKKVTSHDSFTLTLNMLLLQGTKQVLFASGKITDKEPGGCGSALLTVPCLTETLMPHYLLSNN